MRALAVVACVVALAVLFSANARYAYPDVPGALPRLTSRHVVDSRFAGSTFQVAGRVTTASMTSRGIQFIQIHDPVEDVYLDAPVFPSLGCLPVRPQRGDTIRVTGNLGSYGGQPQIRPLSSAHVEVLTSGGLEGPIPLAAALAQTGAKVRVGPITATAVERFVSSSDREHLRLVLAASAARTQEPATARGIMFQGAWSQCELDLLRSGAPIVVTAEVGTFQDEPSLTVAQVAAFK